MSLKLPNHLCEEEDPLATAKAYSLQLLLLTEKIGGKESSRQLMEWISKFSLSEFLNILTQYENCQKIAQQVIPFIKTDIKAYKRQFDCEYIKNESQDTVQKLTSNNSKGDNETGSSSSSCNITITTPLEVDGFLYDDLDEALKVLGLKSDRICTNCNSLNIVEQDIVFTSSSIDSLINLYVVLLRDVLNSESNISASKIGILGSGVGFMVYCAFFFTSVETIISYETDSQLYQIQEKIIEKYGMKSRVKLLQPIMASKSQKNVSCNFIDELDIIIIDGEENVATTNELYTNVLENHLQNPNHVKDGTMIICHDKNVPNYSFLNNTDGSGSFLFKEHLEFSTQQFSIYKVRK